MSPNRVMDSNGPDMKVRGSAAHITEKYRQLARDANAADDRVAAENYLQHAEHYHRMLATMQEHSAQQRAQQQSNAPQPNGRDDRRGPSEREKSTSERPVTDSVVEQSEPGDDQNVDTKTENIPANGGEPGQSEETSVRANPERSTRRRPKVEETLEEPDSPKPRRRPRKAKVSDSEPANESDPTGD